MERRIGAKIDSYTIAFKDEAASKLRDLNAAVAALSNAKHNAADSKDKDQQTQNQQVDSLFKQIISFVYDYEKLKLTKEDFMKRKRVKNIVHLADRCCAKRANGEQCTRRKKDADSEFCGTHLKGTPHGTCELDNDVKPSGQKIEVWAQDIQGIIYYIDKNYNN